MMILIGVGNYGILKMPKQTWKELKLLHLINLGCVYPDDTLFIFHPSHNVVIRQLTGGINIIEFAPKKTLFEDLKQWWHNL